MSFLNNQNALTKYLFGLWLNMLVLFYYKMWPAIRHIGTDCVKNHISYEFKIIFPHPFTYNKKNTITVFEVFRQLQHLGMLKIMFLSW